MFGHTYLSSDANLDDAVDNIDYILWRAAFASTTDLVSDSKGVVDAADYVVWRKSYGTTNVLPNDPTGGTIGTAQYNTRRSHFGQPPSSGATVNTNTAVPEPATLVLLMFSAASWCFRRGRAA